MRISLIVAINTLSFHSKLVTYQRVSFVPNGMTGNHLNFRSVRLHRLNSGANRLSQEGTFIHLSVEKGYSHSDTDKLSKRINKVELWDFDREGAPF